MPLLLLGAVSNACADGVEQLQAFIAQVHAARGRFVQKQSEALPPGNSARSSHLTQRAPVRVSSGTFLFARPGRFIWRYEHPDEQVIQSDGKTFYLYDKDLNQVTLRPLDRAFDASPLAVLFGRHNLEQNYALRPLAARDGCEWLEMRPKKKDEASYQKILIGLRNRQPEIMELQDAFGNTTVLTLHDLEQNPPLHNSAFKFNLPLGVDVIQD